CAASSSSAGTWASPASSSSDMNGVVFQISARLITNSAEARCPNQAKSPSPKTWLTNPVSRAKAYRQAKADTTVMIPYGTRIDVRITRRPNTTRCITEAKTNPTTSSTATVATVMTTVVSTSFHHR